MKKSSLVTVLLAITFSCNAQKNTPKSISKNKMNISWYYENSRIYFEMTAPTKGWVTIGFNTTSGTKGAYLLMGNVVEGTPSLVEHYTLEPGNYKSIAALGKTPQVENLSGFEKNNVTSLKFSLPIKAKSIYQKALTEGIEYNMILAYSREDDFQHHSVMRTSIKIQL